MSNYKYLRWIKSYAIEQKDLGDYYVEQLSMSSMEMFGMFNSFAVTI